MEINKYRDGLWHMTAQAPSQMMAWALIREKCISIGIKEPPLKCVRLVGKATNK